MIRELLNKKSLLISRKNELKKSILNYKNYDEYFKIKYRETYIHNLKLYIDYEYQIKMIDLELSYQREVF